jgi:hypothetical protein
VKNLISVFFVAGLSMPIYGSPQTPDYRSEVIRELVASDPLFAKFPVELRFSTPNYAFVRDLVHPDTRDVFKVVSFDFAFGDLRKDGFSFKGTGWAIVEGTKVTPIDLSKREIEWVFGNAERDSQPYYSSFDAKRYSNFSLLKSLPNQSTDPTP